MSEFQGAIDWTEVAQAGYSFGYALANDGTSPDPTFQNNFAAMKNARLNAGGYLFFRPGGDPNAQANALISSLSEANFTFGDLIPAIDVEVTDGQSAATIVANLQTVVDDVKAALAVAPVIYTSASFWNSALGGSTAFSEDPLWIANWGVSCPNVPSASGGNGWTLWQYADNGRVPGISGPVDLDRSNGTSLPIYRPRATDIAADAAVLQASPPEVNGFTLRAHLSYADDGAPVVGRTVEMILPETSGPPTVICAAVTDTGGTAACNGSAQLAGIVLKGGYTALFAGGEGLLASSAKAGLVAP